MTAGSVVSLEIDRRVVTVPAENCLLEACDAAGSYVPRLCYLPGLACACRDDSVRSSRGAACGLCQARIDDGSVVLACCTPVAGGTRVTTDDPGLRESRREALEALLARHPHICLSCPDRHGCAREECVYGHPLEARCCDEFARCELGQIVAYVDPECTVRRQAVIAPRAATVEGHIRREPGLCIGCGRCVRVCAGLSESARGALVMTEAESGLVARPRGAGLRESGCTFCGLCVMVCPTGAITAPGLAGTRWLATCRERRCAPERIMPPDGSRRRLSIPDDLGLVPAGAGVLTLFDQEDRVVRIVGAPDMKRALAEMLREPVGAAARWLQVELDSMYTQRETELLAQHTREHGCLPPGNDLGDDLFGSEY